MAKTVGQNYISKLYGERVKTASKLDKLANDFNVDISRLSPEEREELAAHIMQETGQSLDTQPNPADGQMSTPVQPGQEFAQNVAPPVETGVPLSSPAMQEKIAETIYLSDLFGNNGAERFHARLQELNKMAEEQMIQEQVQMEDPELDPETGAELEELAMQRAQELAQAPVDEVEKVAIHLYIEKRAQEILAAARG